MTFTNCLVAMRPRTTREELPTRTTVRTNIKNEYVDYIQDICMAICAALGAISINWDLWSEEHAGLAFFGMIAQWIDIQAGRWVLRSAVIAFHKISGLHSGSNLGKYFVKFTDRIGITSKTETNKVRVHASLSTVSLTRHISSAMSQQTMPPTMTRPRRKSKHSYASVV